MPDPHVSRQFKEFGTGDDYDPKTPYGKCIDCREGITPTTAPFTPVLGTFRFPTRRLEFFSCSMLPPNSWGGSLVS